MHTVLVVATQSNNQMTEFEKILKILQIADVSGEEGLNKVEELMKEQN